MQNEDLSITTRTQALILRYEHDRPVIEDAARSTLVREGQEGSRNVAVAVLHPHDPDHKVRDLRGPDWVWAFLENERFADALVKKEAELGIDHLPVHLFGCAPLELMLHLASCLPRRPLRVYQQAPGGAWSLGYDRSLEPKGEDFLQVEGLPMAKQGGRGHVALIVEVTRSIRGKALAEFRARHGSELLTTVVVRPVRGPAPDSIQHPSEVSRAAAQLRGVLDDLAEYLEGAQSVLLAMDCPGSFAAALGSVVNRTTQLPLRLHHYDVEDKQYLAVHELKASRAVVASARAPTGAQVLEATNVLGEVRRVHQELKGWLKEPAQKPLLEAMDGQTLLQSHIEDSPAIIAGPLFRHVGGKWSFDVDLLLGLKRLRERLGTPEDWRECLRLLIVHEVFHVHQDGLTSYNYSGSGRTGFVLEAADFDADAVAVDVALKWREAKQSGMVADAGTVRTLASICWNLLESLRMFEPERPVRELSERRLRRYLIWLFHACRLSACLHSPRTRRRRPRWSG